MDFDELLNYEEECYKNGLETGKQKGLAQGHTEGRELGIQTGYQKFISMGILQARAKHWQHELANGEIAESHRPIIEAISQTVNTPDLENTLKGVEEFDRRLKLAKNKCRLLATATASPPVDAHEQKILYQKGADEEGAIEDMF